MQRTNARRIDPRCRRNYLKDGGRELIWRQTKNRDGCHDKHSTVWTIPPLLFTSPTLPSIARHGRALRGTRPTTPPSKRHLRQNNHSAHRKCIGQAPERRAPRSGSQRDPASKFHILDTHAITANTERKARGTPTLVDGADAGRAHTQRRSTRPTARRGNHLFVS